MLLRLQGGSWRARGGLRAIYNNKEHRYERTRQIHLAGR